MLEDIDKGVSYKIIEERYGIGRSTIGDIKTKKEELKRYVQRVDEEGQSTSAKKLKSGTNVVLDQAIYLWFAQQRENGNPVSGPILQAKAKQLNSMIHPEGNDFDASWGWQHRFCQRHGIRQLKTSGESLSSDHESAAKFIEYFTEMIAAEGYNRDQLFNSDETGLYFRMLPDKTLARHNEKTAAGRKIQKERVTLNVCANAAGTIKLPLHVIGKSAKPRCFKNIDVQRLPVYYSSQKNSWMTCAQFKTWFRDIFVPHVRSQLEAVGHSKKALLLIDNCSAHPEESELVSDDGCIKACFLPPNVTAVIQPMDQGVIESVKRQYRKRLCEALLLADDDNTSLSDFLRRIDLKFVVDTLARVWQATTSTTLRNAWRKLLAEPIEETDHAAAKDIEEIHQLFAPLQLAQFNEDDAHEWLNVDQYVQGHEHLDDAGIVDAVLENNQEEESGDDDDDCENEEGKLVDHGAAFKALDDVICWYSQQPERNASSLLVLYHMKDLAAKKRISTLKQTKINNFFMKT